MALPNLSGLCLKDSVPTEVLVDEDRKYLSREFTYYDRVVDLYTNKTTYVPDDSYGAEDLEEDPMGYEEAFPKDYAYADALGVATKEAAEKLKYASDERRFMMEYKRHIPVGPIYEEERDAQFNEELNVDILRMVLFNYDPGPRHTFGRITVTREDFKKYIRPYVSASASLVRRRAESGEVRGRELPSLPFMWARLMNQQSVVERNLTNLGETFGKHMQMEILVETSHTMPEWLYSARLNSGEFESIVASLWNKEAAMLSISTVRVKPRFYIKETGSYDGSSLRVKMRPGQSEGYVHWPPEEEESLGLASSAAMMKFQDVADVVDYYPYPSLAVQQMWSTLYWIGTFGGSLGPSIAQFLFQLPLNAFFSSVRAVAIENSLTGKLEMKSSSENGTFYITLREMMTVVSVQVRMQTAIKKSLEHFKIMMDWVGYKGIELNHPHYRYMATALLYNERYDDNPEQWLRYFQREARTEKNKPAVEALEWVLTMSPDFTQAQIRNALFVAGITGPEYELGEPFLKDITSLLKNLPTYANRSYEDRMSHVTSTLERYDVSMLLRDMSRLKIWQSLGDVVLKTVRNVGHREVGDLADYLYKKRAFGGSLAGLEIPERTKRMNETRVFATAVHWALEMLHFRIALRVGMSVLKMSDHPGGQTYVITKREDQQSFEEFETQWETVFKKRAQDEARWSNMAKRRRA